MGRDAFERVRLVGLRCHFPINNKLDTFLAGNGNGTRILPPFFNKYRDSSQTSFSFNVSPFESKLPRLYYGMKTFR